MVMEIAVIGWGSLIWCPKELCLRTRWRKDGPRLRIEFARISKEHRLTLVIHPGSRPVQTYWAMSSLECLLSARRNLCCREGTCLSRIHAVDAAGRVTPPEGPCQGIVETIVPWLSSKGLDAAVWTGLGTNWREKRCSEFCIEDALAYLRCLRDNTKATNARKYITHAPAQVRTRVRCLVERELKWKPVALPEDLFDCS